MNAWIRSAATAALPLILLAALSLPASTSAASPTKHPAPGVVTDRGVVGGAQARDVERFLGIPYAAPPTGPLRWRAPRPAARWSGIRNATDFGNPCPVLAGPNGPRSETEDCLMINVWRPVGTKPEDHRPVHVFIHGGGLANGSGSQHDESKLVAETGVIGVSFNYRLGVFGFLRTPGLAAENTNSGNYGFLDQQAALRWIQRNIGAFGGSPDRVTIDGESAGGWSVCGQLTSPGSRGLFRQAMIQSGSCYSSTPSRAEQRGAAYAAAAGCPDAATASVCLRAAPATRLLDASAALAPRLVADTPSFPKAPADAVAAGSFPHVPLLIGANRDEGRTFAQVFIGADRATYEGFVRAVFAGRADEVLQHYPWPSTADRFTAAYLIGAIATDAGLITGIGGCPSRSLIATFARWTPTYAYEFHNRTGPGLTQIDGYVWGAGHAAELAYIWPSFHQGTPIAPQFDRGDRQLARQMVQYWGAFTSAGRPRVPGQARWPRFDRRQATLSLRAGNRSRVIDDATYAAEHQCAFWATMPQIDLAGDAAMTTTSTLASGPPLYRLTGPSFWPRASSGTDGGSADALGPS